MCVRLQQLRGIELIHMDRGCISSHTQREGWFQLEIAGLFLLVSVLSEQIITVDLERAKLVSLV